jgi:hypothetical protein
MAARDTASKSARARSTVPEVIDLEHGTNRDSNHNRETQSDLGIDHVVPPRHSANTPPWKRQLRQRTPAPLARWSRKAVGWVKGPEPAKRYSVTPFFERWQTLPIRLVTRFPKWLCICSYGILCILWIVIFAVVISNRSLPSDIGGFGAPVRLSCVNNLW